MLLKIIKNHEIVSSVRVAGRSEFDASLGGMLPSSFPSSLLAPIAEVSCTYCTSQTFGILCDSPVDN
jgi:hypothetical protein